MSVRHTPRRRAGMLLPSDLSAVRVYMQPSSATLRPWSLRAASETLLRQGALKRHMPRKQSEPHPIDECQSDASVRCCAGRLHALLRQGGSLDEPSGGSSLGRLPVLEGPLRRGVVLAEGLHAAVVDLPQEGLVLRVVLPEAHGEVRLRHERALVLGPQELA